MVTTFFGLTYLLTNLFPTTTYDYYRKFVLDKKFFWQISLNQKMLERKENETQILLDPKYFWTPNFLTFLLKIKSKSGCTFVYNFREEYD